MTASGAPREAAPGLNSTDATAIAVQGSRRGRPFQVRTELLNTPRQAGVIGRILYWFVRAGAGMIRCPDGHRSLEPGDVIAVDGYATAHELVPSPSLTVTTLVFDRDYLVDQLFWLYTDALPDRASASILLDRLYAIPVHSTRLTSVRLARAGYLLDELAEALAGPLDLDQYARAKYLKWQLMGELSALHAQTPATTLAREAGAVIRQEVRYAASLLDRHPGHRWQIAELGARVHLSGAQLRRLFVRAYGITPAEYLARQRIALMAGLLRTGYTVAHAARAAGWVSRGHASRVFTRVMGVTPSDFRATHAPSDS